MSNIFVSWSWAWNTIITKLDTSGVTDTDIINKYLVVFAFRRGCSGSSCVIDNSWSQSWINAGLLILVKDKPWGALNAS